MKYISYGFIYLLTAIGIVMTHYHKSSQEFIMFMLLFVILILMKERFIEHIIFSIIVYLIFFVLIYFNPTFYLLLGIILLDLASKKQVILYISFTTLSILFLFMDFQIELFLVLGFGSIIGYIINSKEEKQRYYLNSLDNERKTRYELETAKEQLLQNSRHIERLTEVKERNRIAQDIHDNIGHDIAGVLIQLQAADKFIERNQHKAREILGLCIDKLSISLEMMHNTVHNIKPVENQDKDIFKNIIDKFIICPIDFQIIGDINHVSKEIINLLASNLKEALTNAVKYSNATLIKIRIEITSKYIRFTYNDNGKGCENIKHGLGLSGMRKRLQQFGGMMHINGEDGFSIINIIPSHETNIFKGGF